MFPFTFLGLTVFLLAWTLALGCLLFAEAFPPSTSSSALAIITACAAFRGWECTLVFYFQCEVYTQIKAKLLPLSSRNCRARVLPFSLPLAFLVHVWFCFGLPTHDNHRPLPYGCLSFPLHASPFRDSSLICPSSLPLSLPFLMLGIEPRISHMLSKLCLWATPSALFYGLMVREWICQLFLSTYLGPLGESYHPSFCSFV